MSVKVKNSGTHFTYLRLLQHFNLSRKQYRFQLKLFDIAVTLKYDQSHSKLYEQVKLSE